MTKGASPSRPKTTSSPKQSFSSMKKSPHMLTPFARLVYAYTKKIPRGKVSTYKLIAQSIGHPGAHRAVGTCLRQNPFAPHVPCHRVIASNTTMGGFQGAKGECKEIHNKIAILQGEGVEIIGGKVAASHVYSVAASTTPLTKELTDELLAAPLV